MVKILFVCYGNSCRSQMAEAMANHLGKGKVRAFSAGTRPLGKISSDTRAVLHEKGITLHEHWSKGVGDVPLREMDVVVEMGAGVKCGLPADFKGRLIRWHIPDPFLLGREHFRDVRDLIEGEVRRLLADLAREPVRGRDSEIEKGNSKTGNGSSKFKGGKHARES
jgi:arsenate reductase